MGCDKVLGSDVDYDKCHVCGGDGTECKTVEGHVHTHHMKAGKPSRANQAHTYYNQHEIISVNVTYQNKYNVPGCIGSPCSDVLYTLQDIMILFSFPPDLPL